MPDDEVEGKVREGAETLRVPDLEKGPFFPYNGFLFGS